MFYMIILLVLLYYPHKHCWYPTTTIVCFKRAAHGFSVKRHNTFTIRATSARIAFINIHY